MLHLGFYNLQSYLSNTPASILIPEFTNPWEDIEPTINIDDLQQYVKTLPYYEIFNSFGEFAVSSQSWEEIISSYRNKLNTEYGNQLLKTFPTYLENKDSEGGVLIEKLDNKGYLAVIFQANKFRIKLYEDLDFLSRVLVGAGWVKANRPSRPLLECRMKEVLVEHAQGTLELDSHQRKDRKVDVFNYHFIAEARFLDNFETKDTNSQPTYLLTQGQWLEDFGINLDDEYLANVIWIDIDNLFMNHVNKQYVFNNPNMESKLSQYGLAGAGTHIVIDAYNSFYGGTYSVHVPEDATITYVTDHKEIVNLLGVSNLVWAHFTRNEEKEKVFNTKAVFTDGKVLEIDANGKPTLRIVQEELIRGDYEPHIVET